MLEEMKRLTKLTKEFIKALLDKINEYYKCFYEEADSNTSFPYLVVPTLSLSPLNAGFICIFDIEIYNNELSCVSVEDIFDDLLNNLDNYHFCNDKIAFHLGFEDGNLQKSSEQDLIIRKISFSARIFRKEI